VLSGVPGELLRVLSGVPGELLRVLSGVQKAKTFCTSKEIHKKM
jgi:hypothetical protein